MESVTFYITGNDELESIFSKIIKRLPGREIIHITIEAGLPHNDYGQTVTVEFSNRKREIDGRPYMRA